MQLYTLKQDNLIFCAYQIQGIMYRSPYTNMNDLIDNYDSIDFPEDPQRIISSNYTILSPILQPRQDVICIGVNYDEHIQETKDLENSQNFENKEYTVYFSKRVNQAIGPDGKIPNYSFVDSLDYEAELAVILKDSVFHASCRDAMQAILGYTVFNDISGRNVQLRHQQWYLGKSLDGYTSMGPCIVTQDEIEDVQNLNIQCLVNGELRQSSNTRYMLTSIVDAIVELSQGMTLEKGTIISTGTPGGVGIGMHPPGFLHPGDEVICIIEGIGKLRNIVEGSEKGRE